MYVDLPQEDKEEGKCGKLRKAMYGTRDAAQNWEYDYTNCMISIGFTRGISTPCAFYHSERNMRAVIHGDDFTILGTDRELSWFREKTKEKHEVKFRG